MSSPPAHTRFKLPSTRQGALALINQIFAFMVMCYVPYILMMPLYEGRRHVVLILPVIVGFFLLSSWMCKKDWHGVSIAMLCLVLTAGPTILYFKMNILMTATWLVMVSGLISCFVVRPVQALLPALLGLASVSGAVWHLSDHVPLQALYTELGRVGIAVVLVSVLAYLLSVSYKRIYSDLSKNHEEIAQALEEAHLQQQRALTALRRAELASEDKSLFLASMSHHLRTPLNAILGYAEILHEELEDATSPVPDSVWTDTERIQIASRHLLELIQDVLNLADIESGTLHMNAQRFALRELCEEIVISMELAAKLNQSTLTLDYQLTRSFFETYDPTWIRQVLFNLLSNAIKFTTDGQIILRVEHNDQWLCVSVEDTGIGLDAEQVEHIFEEFVQADEHTLREFGGTGLGLPLCHKLIARMNGTLHIQSEPGEGTRVSMNLPWPEEQDGVEVGV